MMFRAYCQKMKSPGFLCLVALSLLLFNTSCNNVAITPEPEPVEISFSFVLANDRTNDVAYYESLVAQFNARYPYITVDVDPVNRDPLLQYSEADIFLLDSDEYRDFKERGSILALDSFIEQDKSFDQSDFFPGAMNTASDEGQTWAIPAGVDPFVMFYNKDLFDQNGVDYPDFEWTWDDFLNAAIAISDPDAGKYGYGPAAFGLNSGNMDSWFFIYQHGGRIPDDIQNPTRVIFDDPLTIEALEWYADLFHVHHAAPIAEQTLGSFGGAIEYSIYNGIFDGHVGQWIGTLSGRGGQFYYFSEWPFRWGMVTLPRGAQPFSYAFGDFFAISSQTDNPEAAWKWLAFLTEQVPLRLMPARMSVAESAIYKEQVGEEIAAFALDAMDGAAFPRRRSSDEYLNQLDLFWDAVGKIINEGLTPSEAMSWAERESTQ